MEGHCAGAAFPVTPLLSTCIKIVAILHDVGKRFKRAPLMMTSVATECALIHVALDHLRNFNWGMLSVYQDGRREHMTRATETIILGCTLTLSVIEDLSIELQDEIDGSTISPTEQMENIACVRVLWKGNEMRELLLQLRGYQTGLMNLIRAAHNSDCTEVQKALHHQGTHVGTLLQRSRSSRVLKPLTIRSALAQAATYGNMSHLPTTSKHLASPSTITTNYSQSYMHSSNPSTVVLPSARDQNRFGTLSPTAAGLHACSAHDAVIKKTGSDNAAREAPVVVPMRPKGTRISRELKHMHDKQDTEQLRKSSPTVCDQFNFAPGKLPAFDPSPQRQSIDNLNVSTDEPFGPKSLIQYPRSAPPTGPLPKPPSRCPSRPRSPYASRKPSSRAPLRDVLSRTTYQEEASATKPPYRVRSEDALISTLFADGKQKKPSPTNRSSLLNTRLNPGMIGIEEDRRKHHIPSVQQDQSCPPPQVDDLQQFRKKGPALSIRSQVLDLPETARLRKQVSAEGLAPRQPNAEMLAVKRADNRESMLPIASNRLLRGYDSGEQGFCGSSKTDRRTSILQTGLSDCSRKCSASELIHYHTPDLTATSRRPRLFLSHSSSDTHRLSNLTMRGQPSREQARDQDTCSSTSTYLPSSSSRLSGSVYSQSGNLTPDSEYSPQSEAKTKLAERPSSNSGCFEADEVAASELADTSVKSVQWSRPQCERQGFGTEVSKTEMVSCKPGAIDNEGLSGAHKPRTPKMESEHPPLFSPKVPSRMTGEYHLDRPPRSLPDKGKSIVNVRGTLTGSPRQGRVSLGTETSHRLSSTRTEKRDEETSRRWSGRKKKGKEHRFPVLRGLISEFKDRTNLWYAGDYAEQMKGHMLDSKSKCLSTHDTSLSSQTGINERDEVRLNGPSKGMERKGKARSAQLTKSRELKAPSLSVDTGHDMARRIGSCQVSGKEEKMGNSAALPSAKDVRSKYNSMNQAWFAV